MKLIEEVAALPKNELHDYAMKRARKIAENTSADDEAWDDPEDWQMDAANWLTPSCDCSGGRNDQAQVVPFT